MYGAIPPPLTSGTLSAIMGNDFSPNLSLATLFSFDSQSSPSCGRNGATPLPPNLPQPLQCLEPPSLLLCLTFPFSHPRNPYSPLKSTMQGDISLFVSSPTPHAKSMPFLFKCNSYLFSR
ncbi:hypothetical protein VNO77_27360 [Canavalia gladiata]|uniref:Uncharacterized protein n=1 Tax=Canavalia gladiata TaxID=3824 RepID=A0AAN9KX44_CANGL